MDSFLMLSICAMGLSRVELQFLRQCQTLGLGLYLCKWNHSNSILGFVVTEGLH